MSLTFSLILCWIAIVAAFPHVKHPYLFSRVVKIRVAAIIDPENDAASKRLPLLQFYQSGSPTSEIWFNDIDFDMSLAKFEALMRRITSETSLKSLDQPLLNIYSDNMLVNALQNDVCNHQVLKVYSSACQSCQRFEPTFASAVQKFGSKVSFMQANIDHIPNHMDKIRAQYFESIASDAINACQSCSGSGKVPCTNCVGKGFAMKGNIAVICGTCGGKKITRCNTCGGVCVNCTV